MTAQAPGMETAYFVIAAAFVGAAVLGFFFTRHIWLAALAPAGLVWFVTIGWMGLSQDWSKASGEAISFFIGLSAMVLVPYALISTAGAFVGKGLAQTLRGASSSRPPFLIGPSFVL
jgi:hypothetical protein